MHQNDNSGSVRHHDPFGPERPLQNFEIPIDVIARLASIAQISDHSRPDFDQIVTRLFLRAQSWHHVAGGGEKLDTITEELEAIATLASKLKMKLERLRPEARVQFGLNAIRAEKYGAAGKYKQVRFQLTDLLHSGERDNALGTVDTFLRHVERIREAASLRLWPKRKKGNPAHWKDNYHRSSPYVDNFNLFMIELGELLRPFGGSLRFELNDVDDGLTSFLRCAVDHLPKDFVPKGVFYCDENGNRPEGYRLRQLLSHWRKE